MIDIIQYGIGPIGMKITEIISERPGLRITGAVDIDPDKTGKNLGELAGVSTPGVTITDNAEDLLEHSDAEVVVLTTTSSLEKIYPQIMQILSNGKNIISTCEELTYPWNRSPETAEKIDATAVSNGVSVLSTGVNPGFLMDLLPVVLTGVCRNVERITVERVQDAQYRRIPFQQKIGAGLSPDEFEAKLRKKSIQHVGLTESMHMIADGLGWKLDKTEDIGEPVLAEKTSATRSMTIERGSARGILQTGRGFSNGEEIITLLFKAAVGEPESFDHIHIQGDPVIDSTIKNGVNGDTATCSIITNAIRNIAIAQPGLKTMLDISPVHFYAG